jgi:hypothetical protein
MTALASIALCFLPILELASRTRQFNHHPLFDFNHPCSSSCRGRSCSYCRRPPNAVRKMPRPLLEVLPLRLARLAGRLRFRLRLARLRSATVFFAGFYFFCFEVRLQCATYPQSPISAPACCCDVTDPGRAFSQQAGPGRLWISLAALCSGGFAAQKGIEVD